MNVDKDVEQKDREWEQALAMACGTESTNELDDAEWNEDKAELRSEPDSSKDEYVMAEALPYSPSSRPTSISLSATGGYFH